MLDNLAESRVRGLGLRKGSLECAKELAQVTGYLRRRLSSAVMQANVKCLLERILLAGKGQGQAGKRRQWARVEEERARLEREAQWLVKDAQCDDRGLTTFSRVNEALDDRNSAWRTR